MRRPPPDFVIVGAPKCATTAVYKALRQHPEIFLPGLKEPQYFAFDHNRGRAVQRIDFYDRLFTDASEAQLRGDASILYLSSTRAIPAILERRPDAKFIALIRDPVDLFISWHNECLKSLDEDERNPECAWRLQGQRANGRVPKLCKEPAYLQYRQICGLGRQIQNMFEWVPASQRLVIVLDSLSQDPSGVHRQITGFLGIEDTGVREFSRENAFAAHQNRVIARMIRLVHISGFFKELRLRLKPIFNKYGIYPLTWAKNYSLKETAKPILSGDFEQELREEFRSDILLLEKLLDRDFSAWLGTRLRRRRSSG